MLLSAAGLIWTSYFFNNDIVIFGLEKDNIFNQLKIMQLTGMSLIFIISLVGHVSFIEQKSKLMKIVNINLN